MHLITLTKPYHDKLRGRKLEPGTYLCEDLTAFEIGVDAQRGTVTLEPFVKKMGDTTHVLAVSNGGYGDALLWTPALREFNRVSRGRDVYISCPEKTQCVFDNLPYRPGYASYPYPYFSPWPFGDVICSEHLQEGMEIGRTTPAIDIKAALLGVKLDTPEKRRVEYIVSAEESAWATSTYPRTQHRRLGLQLRASAPGRTPHPDIMSKVMSAFYAAGWELFLFGSPSEAGEVPAQYRARVRDLSADKLTFRQSAAVAQTCDVLLCPDSGLVHIAGALGIPAVGLFGVVDWKLRTADYPTVRVLQGREGCDLAPCTWHPKGHRLWPEGAPCEKAGSCVALNSITPERIVATVNAQYGKYLP